ncbi:aldo/keto reductase [Pseudolabrys taiwanensis]|uniref:Aldo/keto reductase n=1 Tax=Pseudolabrys taiwanensis TaxID=331696 RepID=A0A345ZRQ8_9HYPH|nr:aldo/keto reductase [Pseudolabrys taiwanensis]AXK79605.1 aldo/keto reductase [Pseudolabrys taiwanensis]
MQLRPLGRSGLQIAPLMLGGNVFGWSADEKTSFAILDAFVDAGFNAVDTADSYSRWAPGHSGGESETVIGRWFKQSGKRDKVVIATKVGSDMGEGKCVRKDYILRSTEASLKRLQVDCIDLYQTHFDNEETPVEETLEAYAQLIKAGKVRAIGASNLTPARLTASLAASAKLGVPRYETLQPLYNLVERSGFETDYLPIVREHGLGVIPFYALAAGFLTGKYRTEADARKNAARGGKVKGYLNPRGVAILDALDQVASRQHATPAQIALAWLLAKPGVTAPIASATSLEQLKDILKAPALKLSAEDIAALDQASA